MDREFRSGAVAAAPPIPTGVSSGHPTVGDPASSVPATIIGARWFHAVTEEALALIARGGIAPDAGALNQWAAAVVAIANERAAAAVAGINVPQVGPATAAVAGIAEIANQAEGRGGADNGRIMTALRVLDALRNGTEFAATDARKGAVGLATAAELTQENPPADKVVTAAGLAGFFGAASYREYNAPGAYQYMWEWGTPNGLAILVGAGGGGGGANNFSTLAADGATSHGGGGGGGAGSTDGDDGDDAQSSSLVTNGGPGGAGAFAGGSGGRSRVGAGAGGGGSTSMTVNGNTDYARGGGGASGGGFRNSPRGDGNPGGFDGGGAGDYPSATAGQGGDAGTGSRGNGGAGAVGSINKGGDGGAGELKVVALGGLSVGGVISGVVGSGGIGGQTWKVGPAGSNGGAGRVILIPLF